MLAGPVLKRMRGHGRYNVKQLVLAAEAAAPANRRLFYVDAQTLKAKDCEKRVEPFSGKNNAMRIQLGGAAYRVQCVIHTPATWQQTIESLSLSVGQMSEKF